MKQVAIFLPLLLACGGNNGEAEVPHGPFNKPIRVAPAPVIIRDAGADACEKAYCNFNIPSTSETPRLTKEFVAPKCPNDMGRINGDYCPDVQQVCKKWLDPAGSRFARCQEYNPSVCLSKTRTHMDFCIDKLEYTRENEELPLVNVNFYEAEKICQSKNKRLCSETEFEFACEGPDMNAYAIGNTRGAKECNHDLVTGLIGANGKLVNRSVPSKSLTKCVNWTGEILALNGNVGEITVADRKPYKTKLSLRGGWFSPVRNRCLAREIAHDEFYKNIETSFRCCRNIN